MWSPARSNVLSKYYLQSVVLLISPTIRILKLRTFDSPRNMTIAALVNVITFSENFEHQITFCFRNTFIINYKILKMKKLSDILARKSS